MKAPFPNPSGRMPGILYLKRLDAALFWPHDFVAMLRDEGTGRLEATSADGEVAHCVASLSDHLDGPWIRIADDTLVHPAHARQDEDALVLPGGWRIPFAGPLPPARPAVPEPFMEGTRVRPGEVSELGMRDGSPVWITDRGEVPCGCKQSEAGRRHGDLVRIGRSLVNRRRVRVMTWEDGQTAIRLDNGKTVRVVGRLPLPRIRTALGLPPHPREDEMSLFHKGLFLFELRDFPWPLFEAPSEVLRGLFPGRPFHLIANVLWQVVRLRRQGRGNDYGATNRGLWYRPLLPILTRAGLTEDLYRIYQRVCLTLIGQYRLFRYSDLGFRDHRPDLRSVGQRHPEVVILCEKVARLDFVRRLGARFGVSFQVFHGQPRLLDTEYLARALGTATPVHVVAYVDYDDAGWIIADAFVEQLGLYGVPVASLRFLVTPDRFTAAELRSYAHALQGTGAERTKIRAWVKRSGGIHGRARGIYSDHLVPYERVEQTFAEVAGVHHVD